MWADSLTMEEVEATLSATEELRTVSWAVPLLRLTKPILDRLRAGIIDREAYRANPLQPSEMSFLFEIRFARSLAQAGVVAEYEYGASVGNTTIDFRVKLDPPWLVELVSLHESAAFKQTAWTSGDWYGYALRTDAGNPKHSEEGETLKAQERIGNKVLDDQRPIKFPEPNGSIHMLMVDARGYMGGGHADKADWHQLAYGPRGLEPHFIKFWTNPTTGTRAPIMGLFEAGCPLPASRIMQERIHFIGFICERKFASGEIKEQTFYCGNPALLADEHVARSVMSSWPLSRSGAVRE